MNNYATTAKSKTNVGSIHVGSILAASINPATIIGALTAVLIAITLSVPALSIPALASRTLGSLGAPDGPGAITGTITDQGNAHLAGVEVTAYRYWKDVWVQEAVTFSDSNGQYTLGGLQVGRYRIGADELEGLHQETYYGNVVGIQDAPELSVAGNLTENIDIVMVPGGGMSGTIDLSETLPPLQNARIVLALYEDGADEPTYEFIQSTDSTSGYEIRGLKPGSYAVCLSLWVYTDFEYKLRECHSGFVGDLEDAPLVLVEASQSTSEINFSLGSPANYGQVAGQVTDDTGAPLAGINVILQSEEPSIEYSREVDKYSYQFRSGCFNSAPENLIWAFSGDGNRKYCAVTDESGQYALQHVIPSSYTVNFQDSSGLYASQYYSDTIEPENVQPLEILPGSDIDGVDATLSTGGRITGTILVQDISPPNTGSRVQAHRAEGGSFWVKGLAEIDPFTGSYELSGLPTGTYSLTVITSRYTNAPAFENESAPTVEITASQTVSNVNFSLAEGLYNGIIQGQVNHGGAPLEGIRVELLTLNDAYPEPVYYTATDSDGNYKIEGLGDGENRLRFLDTLGNYVAQFYNETTTLSEAETIAVGHQETRKIDVELQQAGSISGSVQDPSGRVRSIGVKVRRLDSSEQPSMTLSTVVDSMGNFLITGLAPGEYLLDFYDKEEFPYQTEVVSLLQMEATVTSGETTNRMGVLGAGAPTALETTEEPSSTKPILTDAIFIPFTTQ